MSKTLICLFYEVFKVHVVETRRIELLTPCLQGRCSPSWATPPWVHFFFFQPALRHSSSGSSTYISTVCGTFLLIPWSDRNKKKHSWILQSTTQFNFKKLVGLRGLGPLTSRLSGVRSNQLSYRPMDCLRVKPSKPNIVLTDVRRRE